MLKLWEMQNSDVLGDNKILASTNIFFKKVLQAQGNHTRITSKEFMWNAE
jgi:hypothetical protein